MRLHDLSITAFGPFVETVHVDFDELAAGGLFLLTGDTGPARPACSTPCASRSTARFPATGTPHATCAATRPAAHVEPRVVLRLSVGGAHVPVHPLPRVGAPQATRQRHHPGPGPRRRRGAAVGRVGRADQPARRGGPAGHRPARHDLHPVHPGGDAAAGPVPGVPARQLRRAARRAAAAVPHATVRGGRAVAGRATRRAAAPVPDPSRRCAQAWSTGSRRLPGSAYPTSGTCTPSTPSADGRLPRALGRRHDWPQPCTEPSNVGRSSTAATAAVHDATSRRSTGHARWPRPGTAAARPASTLAGARGLRRRGDVGRASLDAHRRAAPVLPQAVRAGAAETQHAEAEQPSRRPGGRGGARCSASRPTRSTSSALAAAITRLRRGPRASRSRGCRASASCATERTTARRPGDGDRATLGGLTRATERAAELAGRSRPRSGGPRRGARPSPSGRPPTAAASSSPSRGSRRPPRRPSSTAELTGAAPAWPGDRPRPGPARRPTSTCASGASPGWPPSSPAASPSAAPARSAAASSTRRPATASTGASAATTRTRRANATRTRTSSDRPSRSWSPRWPRELQGALLDSGGHTVTHWRRAAATAAAAATASAAAERDAARLREELAHDGTRGAGRRDPARPRSRVALEERTRERAEVCERHDGLDAELDALLSGHPGITSVGALVDGPPAIGRTSSRRLARH